MSIKYRTSAGTSASNFTDLVVKVGDTLPIGTEVDYDGQTAPAGWQEVDDPNVYSTSETKIGTWVDGKPLYRKVFILNNIVASTSNSDFVDLSGMYIGDVVHLYGIYDAVNVGKFPIPLTDSDQNYCVLFVNYSNKIRGRFVNGAPSINARIILEYTKTTD